MDMLFCIGGDGTQRGAFTLYEACAKRGHALSVVGIPKTIDNDVRYVSRTFGYLTAIDESRRVIDAAHTEARSLNNGISVVKLMGRPTELHAFTRGTRVQAGPGVRARISRCQGVRSLG
jgi:6-phosphofructokinase 1